MDSGIGLDPKYSDADIMAWQAKKARQTSGRAFDDGESFFTAGERQEREREDGQAKHAHANDSSDDGPRDDVPPVGETVTPDAVVLRCCADVPQRPVEWLSGLESILAIGKLTLLGGMPGTGKSQIACHYATRLKNSSIIFLSAEDGAADTLVPRLDLAGADLRRMHFYEAVRVGDKTRSFSLQSDLELLSREVKRLDDVGLITIDPVTSYMGSIDSHRTTDVRAVLEPLGRFAEDHRLAVLAITHPPKGATSNAINAFTGSLAYVAAARVAFVTALEPETDRRLLLPVKNNLAPLGTGTGYAIVPGTSRAGIPTSRIVFDNLPVNITANEALAAAAKGGDRGTSKREAEDFLKKELANGPRDAGEMRDKAVALGIASRTLQRARNDLDIIAEKHGFQGTWTWRLP